MFFPLTNYYVEKFLLGRYVLQNSLCIGLLESVFRVIVNNRGLARRYSEGLARRLCGGLAC